jgi:hypothetical protein
VFTIDPETKNVGFAANKVQDGPVVDPITGKLFALGQVNGNNWDPSTGIEMATTDEDIFTMEACLLKLSTQGIMENPAVGHIVRQHGARIVEVNPTYSIVEMKGNTDDILSLFQKLDEMKVVLQFVRSGRIAVTKLRVELLDKYLAERELEQ